MQGEKWTVIKEHIPSKNLNNLRQNSQTNQREIYQLPEAKPEQEWVDSKRGFEVD